MNTQYQTMGGRQRQEKELIRMKNKALLFAMGKLGLSSSKMSPTILKCWESSPVLGTTGQLQKCVGKSQIFKDMQPGELRRKWLEAGYLILKCGRRSFAPHYLPPSHPEFHWEK